MSEPQPSDLLSKPIEVFIRFGLILLLASWCYAVMAPFLVPMLWALIIAVALYPLFMKFRGWFGGRSNLAATVLTLLLILLVLIPSIKLGSAAIDSLHDPLQQIQDGTFELPALPEGVSEWPVIGEDTARIWSQAQDNLTQTLRQYEEQVSAAASWLVGKLAGTTAAILTFTFALIIAGLFMANAKALVSGCNLVAARLFGHTGEQYVDMAGSTIRSVAQGVIGVATIQAILSAIGLYLAGAPAAALWSALVLLLAIAQLPPILILGPVAAYLFGAESTDTTTATLFLVWSIIVSASDAFLKPLLLGRGVDIPMVIVLMGAIGGMMAAGIIGLFVGSVVLAVAYKLAQAWVTSDDGSDPESDSDTTEVEAPQQS